MDLFVAMVVCSSFCSLGREIHVEFCYVKLSTDVHICSDQFHCIIPLFNVVPLAG